jgi:hypothetical protein
MGSMTYFYTTSNFSSQIKKRRFVISLVLVHTHTAAYLFNKQMDFKGKVTIKM